MSNYTSFFLFLLSTALFLGSFFIRVDPEGIPYCMGDRTGATAEAGPEAAVMVLVVGGTGGGGGPDAWGATAVSGRGLGKMCLSRLFL